ncbi:AAA family ATPase [Actinoplanes sp. NPDC051851]|uniref:AAA family ATPase n=1 Tax=Actinoplanes sp. NPDC051851 TaxID=3154753 RepID=UPI00344A91E3
MSDGALNLLLGVLLAVPFAITANVVTPWFASLLSRISFRRELTTERLRWEQENPAHDDATADDDDVLPPALDGDPTGAPYYYLRRLRILNLRCFSAVDVTFRYPGDGSTTKISNVNLLLGDNGSGKSTILKAAAMAALGPVLDASGFVPFRLVRQGQEKATVTGTFAFGGESEDVTLSSRVDITHRGDFELAEARTNGPFWDTIYRESSPAFFVVGYGVNRHVAEESRIDPSLEKGRRRRRFQRVSSLFDETVSLTPIGSWLRGVDRRRADEINDLLRELLPESVRFTGDFESDDPIFTRRGAYVPFRALSDGFRSYVGWLGDLLFHIHAVTPRHVKLRDMGGIVLVDEIDLLLHPAWQRLVVPAVAGVFHNVQFLFTTHSPLVTGTLESANILVTREPTGSGGSGVDRVDAEVHGLSAEQVLLSSYFELSSTRAPDAAADLADLARRAVAGDEEARR